MNIGEASGDAAFVLDEVASRKAIDSIRRAAVDGLLALPRVGMGVGGFLLGVRRNGQVQILDHLEIPCAHARGPGFVLSPEEIEHALTLRATAAPLEVLGMYLSRTRGPVELANADLELFRALCPGADEIALVLRPSTVRPALAAIFSKGAGAHEAEGVSRRLEWEIESRPDASPIPEPVAEMPAAGSSAVHALKMAAAAVPPEPGNENADAQSVPARSNPERIANADQNGNARINEFASPAAEPASKPARPPQSPPAREAVPEPETVSAPGTMRPRPQFPRHSVLFREPERRESSRRKRLYAAGAVVLIAAAAVLSARGHWLDRPELSLKASADQGAVVFRWNRDAVAGADAGKLLVSDAGQLSEFRLDSARLAAGSFRYPTKSDHVVAKIVVGEQSARALFFADSPSPSGTPAGGPALLNPASQGPAILANPAPAPSALPEKPARKN